jgi:hypothetical protein
MGCRLEMMLHRQACDRGIFSELQVLVKWIVRFYSIITYRSLFENLLLGKCDRKTYEFGLQSERFTQLIILNTALIFD